MSIDIDNELKKLDSIDIEPSIELVDNTKKIIRSIDRQKLKNRKRNINILKGLTAVAAIIVLVFSLMASGVLNNNIPVYDMAAIIYTIDINPSVELGVDETGEVVEIRCLNDDAKELMKKVNCLGMDIQESIRLLIQVAEYEGFITDDKENYVVVSEIITKSDEEEVVTVGKDKIKEIISESSDLQVNVVYLEGDVEDKQAANQDGISVNKVIIKEKAENSGLQVSEEEITDNEFDEVVKTIIEEEKNEEKNEDEDQELENEKDEEIEEEDEDTTNTDYISSNIKGIRNDKGEIVLNWGKINHSEFEGYKIVVSKTNPNPKYPEDGYIRYITDENITNMVIDEEFKDKLVLGKEYYFSITAIYKDKKVAGNAVKLKYMDEEQPKEVEVYTSTKIYGVRRDDGEIVLEWDKIDNEKFKGYKIVASKSNPNPKYPEDGYIKYITNINTTRIEIDESFSEKLEKGQEYYFSITVVYEDKKLAGNSVKLKYMDEEDNNECNEEEYDDECDEEEYDDDCDDENEEHDEDCIDDNSYKSSTIEGERLENGEIKLYWSKANSEGFKYYKVVASKDDPNPKYPEDGYIMCIENRDTTQLHINKNFKNKLELGERYYFSITVVYEDNVKKAGNSVKLKYMNEEMPEEEYLSSKIYGVRREDGELVLEWEKVEDERFKGYKIVASKTNPSPKYPDDGYIKWITNRDSNRIEIDDSYAEKLEKGQEYYFSITVVYDDNVKKAGNSVKLKYMNEEIPEEEYLSSTIYGVRREDGELVLEWDEIEDDRFEGYKIVASKTNSSPKYPDDGYIKWITNRDANRIEIDESYAEKLEKGQEYYFSITVVYDDNVKKAGNSVKLKYMNEEE